MNVSSMKTKDTTLSDLFMQTALSLDHSSAESMVCVCQFLRHNPQAHEGFIEAFKPDDVPAGRRWFDNYYGNPRQVSKDELQAIKAHRITAVLFMHELAKDFENNLGKSEI